MASPSDVLGGGAILHGQHTLADQLACRLAKTSCHQHHCSCLHPACLASCKCLVHCHLPALGPIMCTPIILSVLASAMNLTMPSVSSTLRARLLAMNENLPTCSDVAVWRHILVPLVWCRPWWQLHRPAQKGGSPPGLRTLYARPSALTCSSVFPTLATSGQV